MKAITDARGGVTRCGYDLCNRRISKTYPDGSAETWGHDAVGNPVSRRTPSGKLATSLYDNRHRLLSTDWSDATPDVAFAYDAAGRVVAATSSASALSYLYNAAGELVSETQEIRAPQVQPARTVGYRYDADGNRAALVYPDGSETTYGYTARNELATVIAGGPPPLATYGYDLAGNRIRKTLENGTSTAYSYDAAQRLLGVNHKLGTAPLNIAYTLNATGNRTARAESFAGTTRREAYGAIDQLIETRLNPVGTANERRVGYVYDAAGNRTRVVEDADGTGPGTAQERVYSANALNQYTAISGLAAPLHDIDGNTTLLQSGARLWSYQYDAQNRLVSGTDGATTFQFHYDARNRCVARVINGEVRYLTYDGWSLLEDRDNAGRLSAKHLHGVAVDEVLATVTPAGARYLHQDGLGNVVALTDGSGVVLERVRYDAYGQPEHLTSAGAVSGVSPTGNRFLFTGREWFSELGLQDNRHRYYQPGIGRWLSRDPIGELGGLNVYGYVLNNPATETDALGLVSSPQATLIAAIARGDIATVTLLLESSEFMLSEAAIEAAKVFLKKVAVCTAIYAAYDAIRSPGCGKCTSKAEAETISLQLTAEIAGRTAYLKEKCDYVMAISIARGSKKAEKGHQQQLAQKTVMLAKCAAKISSLP